MAKIEFTEKYWRSRAEKARALADNLIGEEIREVMRCVAASYECIGDISARQGGGSAGHRDNATAV